ncbi:hypothetical protein CDEST_01918 [Colletotrichum destructivum]|uniref:Uncharacterized protein n=1 Tax=Colletotrichum destructivum TaxID=34406 RepID=A0AAX4I100_9PEZI|nr:hypothetical protein CDEST_01918 [Colletotrichum destructivum]
MARHRQSMEDDQYPSKKCFATAMRPVTMVALHTHCGDNSNHRLIYKPPSFWCHPSLPDPCDCYEKSLPALGKYKFAVAHTDCHSLSYLSYPSSFKTIKPIVILLAHFSHRLRAVTLLKGRLTAMSGRCYKSSRITPWVNKITAIVEVVASWFKTSGASRPSLCQFQSILILAIVPPFKEVTKRFKATDKSTKDVSQQESPWWELSGPAPPGLTPKALNRNCH